MADAVRERVEKLNGMVLEGKIKIRGVQIPIEQDIYDPVLAELEKMNIRFTETRSSL